MHHEPAVSVLAEQVELAGLIGRDGKGDPLSAEEGGEPRRHGIGDGRFCRLRGLRCRGSVGAIAGESRVRLYVFARRGWVATLGHTASFSSASRAALLCNARSNGRNYFSLPDGLCPSGNRFIKKPSGSNDRRQSDMQPPPNSPSLARRRASCIGGCRGGVAPAISIVVHHAGGRADWLWRPRLCRVSQYRRHDLYLLRRQLRHHHHHRQQRRGQHARRLLSLPPPPATPWKSTATVPSPTPTSMLRRSPPLAPLSYIIHRPCWLHARQRLRQDQWQTHWRLLRHICHQPR